MRSSELVYIILVCSGCVLSTLTIGEGDLTASAFPPGFIFGTGTSAYQSEGAWNEGGKGENIWDRALHSANITEDNSNADIASDSYHQYKEDIKLAKQTGFSMFRFSISWSRVLPKGTNDYINKEGLEYYRNMLKELARHNIEPQVTLYHWDLPQPLQDIGGWMNETMVYHFQNYARVIFETLGHQVKWWTTFNEPFPFVTGYSSPKWPPRLGLNGVGDYIAAHNVLKAHAKVYRMYEKEFKPIQKGMMSISIFFNAGIPKTDSEEDVRAAEQAMQFQVGWLTHPIYSSTGDYPPVMRKIIDRNSLLEGRNKSRLPYFTPEEIEEIKGSADYLSANNYATSKYITFGVDPSYEDPSYERDSNVLESYDTKWSSTRCPAWMVNMESVKKTFNWIRENYGDNLPIFITESGYCGDSSINDIDRVNFFDSYLKALLKVIVEDGVNVIGYISWTLTDVFEWLHGYTVKFGLYHVNFTDPQRPRKKKLSADYWERFLNQ